MLKRDTLPTGLWELLQTLMALKPLADFYLVGGTGLALRLGHRVSVDIDLFCPLPFDSETLFQLLRKNVELTEAARLPNTLRGNACGIKIECIAHQYPLLEPVELQEGIRIASLSDLAAFKGNAISNRGAKKDFWDVHAILDHLSWREFLDCCGRKYRGDSLWNVEKSLLYFEDAEDDPDPMDLRGMEWEQIKQDLRQFARRNP